MDKNLSTPTRSEEKVCTSQYETNSDRIPIEDLDVFTRRNISSDGVYKEGKGSPVKEVLGSLKAPKPLKL